MNIDVSDFRSYHRDICLLISEVGGTCLDGMRWALCLSILLTLIFLGWVLSYFLHRGSDDREALRPDERGVFLVTNDSFEKNNILLGDNSFLVLGETPAF